LFDAIASVCNTFKSDSKVFCSFLLLLPDPLTVILRRHFRRSYRLKYYSLLVSLKLPRPEWKTNDNLSVVVLKETKKANKEYKLKALKVGEVLVVV